MPVMEKVIVTTSIHSPTKAIRLFDAMPDWRLIVIGDKKTPHDMRLDRGIYMSPEEQEKYDKKLSDLIGWNCIQRRNFGLLLAREMKAEIIALVDDDNIPYDFWRRDLMIGRRVEVHYWDSGLRVFDPLGATNTPHLWHRGYPLPLLSKRRTAVKSKKIVEADVQADLWNGDPDIDAVCRMEHAPEVEFDPHCFPMAGSKMAPFNSQNTFLRASLLKDYFLFPHIGRMDDIWAAYYLQAKRGARVVFGRASVYQARNEHDLIEDMRQEYLGYEKNLSLVQDLSKNPSAIFNYLPERAVEAFQCYQRHFDV